MEKRRPAFRCGTFNGANTLCFAILKASSTYFAGIPSVIRLTDVLIPFSAALNDRDIAGEQRFGTMTKTYFRGAHAVIIMFDLTNKVSWEDVDIWRQDVILKLGAVAADMPVLVVGNKVDLINENKQAVVTEEGLAAYVAQHNLWKGYVTARPKGRSLSVHFFSTNPESLAFTNPSLLYIRIMLSARHDSRFGEAVAEMAQIVHVNTPTKAVSPAEQKQRQSGSLRVLTKSPMDTRTESPKRSRSGSSTPKGVLAQSSSSNSSNHHDDDDHVYTHTDNSDDGKSECCVIS